MSVDVTRRTALALIGAGLSQGLLPRMVLGETSKPVELTMAPGRVALVGAPHPDTEVWAFDGSVPGPILRARQGEVLEITVTNELDEPTTVHWHGLRVPVGMDGMPYLSQPPIEPGGTFVYRLPLRDAGTYWYHPHLRSSEQVGRGLYGALIIDEPEPPAIDRELLWVLDDWRLDQQAQIQPFGSMRDASHNGRLGNTATINGKLPTVEPVRAGERIRLRLINAANARTFAPDFGELSLWVIALDGQPVEPYRLDESPIVLGASMRADLIIDMTGDPGSESQVVDGHYGPDHAYELIRFAYADTPPLGDGEGPAPGRLAANPIAEPDLATAERHEIVFEGGAMGGMRGAMMDGRMMSMRDLADHGRLWAMNGAVPTDLYRMPPLVAAATGSSHLIELVNRTAFEHPIHLHGHTFRVVRRNGQEEPRQPLRDTVLLGVDETVEIAFVADNPGEWMFHCHVLEHQESGMMGVIDVA